MGHDPRASENHLALRAEALLDTRRAAQDGLGNFLSGIDVYGTDPGTTARPDMDGRLQRYEIAALYADQDLAKRIVNEVVNDSIRSGWTVFDAATRALVLDPEHLPVRRIVREAGRWGRLDGVAVALLIPDANIGVDTLAEPPDLGAPVENILTFTRAELSVTEYEDDIASPHYGRALRYRITPIRNGAGQRSGALTSVHRDHLLRFDGEPLPKQMRNANEDFEDSVLQSVWDAVRRFLQTEASIASIIQRFETATISISGLAGVLAAEDGECLINKRMAMFQRSLSLLNAALIDADSGEKYERKFATVTGLDVLWDRFAHSVAKAARIPMTQLFGMSPSGLSTDDQSGRANWRKEVSAYQEDQLHPNLVKLYTRLNGGRPVEVRFSPSSEATADEESKVAESKARTRSMYVGGGLADAADFRAILIREGVIDPPEVTEPEAAVAPTPRLLRRAAEVTEPEVADE